MTISDKVLRPDRSPDAPSRIVAAGLLAWAIALTPAYVIAADNDNEPPKQAEAPKERGTQQQAASNDPADKAPNDLESCKRDADGMRGPERSRFMTSCLKARK